RRGVLSPYLARAHGATRSCHVPRELPVEPGVPARLAVELDDRDARRLAVLAPHLRVVPEHGVELGRLARRPPGPVDARALTRRVGARARACRSATSAP